MKISLFSQARINTPSCALTLSGSMILLCSVALGLTITFQQQLDDRFDRNLVKREGLAQLPPGQYLKPALLGYHHLAADILWLRVVQILGETRNSAEEYEWMYHALDVITTLDPQYAYVYYAGGVVLTNLAGRVDWSNYLLERGFRENPHVWNIPFLLGYNHYFVLGYPSTAADYVAAAARLPGGPSYLPGLATRMYAEADNPEVAFQFLEALWRQTQDPEMREVLEKRTKEVIIERDIKALESAVERYRTAQGHNPRTLQDVVRSGILVRIPEEPFGGLYEFDSATEQVSSTSHPDRLKVFRLDKMGGR